MIDLAGAQRAVYEALADTAGGRCFVRLCRDDGALWVTDLPLRGASTDRAQAALASLGVRWEAEPATGLWRLDWTGEEWRGRLDALPDGLPPFPRDEALHTAYALCRLLLAHPAPLREQPMQPIRGVVKRSCGPGAGLLRAVPAWLGDSARRLRQGEALAHGAGKALACWLEQMERLSI